MRMPTVHRTLALLGLLLALGSSTAALADHWDTTGGKFNGKLGVHPGRGVGLGQVHAGRGNAYGRAGSGSQVNIIVTPPATVWAPRWNDRYDRRYERRHHDPLFNSSLGFIAGAVVGLATTTPQAVERHYIREYQAPVVVIDRSGHGRSISLVKDRYGACYERETDRHGRVIRRRVADYYCNF